MRLYLFIKTYYVYFLLVALFFTMLFWPEGGIPPSPDYYEITEELEPEAEAFPVAEIQPAPIPVAQQVIENPQTEPILTQKQILFFCVGVYVTAALIGKYIVPLFIKI